jgi:hypothetical protein
MIDMHQVVGRINFLFITFDCLRYDVACQGLALKTIPQLACVLPETGWEKRESPATFTLAAHLAFFHGFLPTPVGNGPHPRLLAVPFAGSLTIVPETYTFEGVDNLLAGFHALGYRSFCIGGVGFFNKRNPLGQVLPGYFQESVWSPAMSVATPDSTAVQVSEAVAWLATLGREERFFLFVNISATHPPHAHYLPGAQRDCLASQAAALAYVDTQLPPLFRALREHGETFCLFMSDHGEAHGEDGRFGHRLAHPTVTTVPYAHFIL